jgi:hypothetical protein
MTTSIKIWIAAFAITLFAVVFFLTNTKSNPEEYSRPPYQSDSLKFNSVEWKRSVDDVDAVRPYMLGDLRKNILKAGMKRSDIESLLGETLPWNNHGKLLYYRVGIFEGMEPTYLVIELDENDRFKTSSLHDY